MARTPRTTTILLCLAALSASLSTTGCRVNDTDVKRWETTELGPTKLVAVITHDKYEWPLRTDAAMALVRMKPRAGRRIGIGKLQEAVASLPAADRAKLVANLAPLLVKEIDKPPVAQQGVAEQKGGDPSIPFKDAAYALVSYDKAALVTDEAVKKTLTDALIRWATADFDRRIAISSQLYNIEQIFRFIGADAGRALPPLVKPDSAFDRMTALVAEIGDPPTKDKMAQALVALGQYTEGQEWFTKNKQRVKEANETAGYKVADDKLDLQTKDYQEEQVTKVFAALKKVGGRPAVEYLLGVGGDKAKPPKRREAALAALDGRLDRSNPNDAARVIEIAKADETPDAVRQQAFSRAAEFPRDSVAPKLYEIVTAKDQKKWKVRWVAASTVLKLSQAANLPEFYTKLPPGPAAGFAMSEPVTYGDIIGKMTPPPKKEDWLAQAKDPQLSKALVAFGYFYSHGRAADVPAMQAMEADARALPKVEDGDGKWQCPAPKEMKDMANVGEFVKYCVIPAMQARK
ncbi:MAG: hypothetical protein IT374_00060 [Polyangiaceae bacterium]|nr:hypothetical protein [Polyangiaceae bacterium]